MEPEQIFPDGFEHQLKTTLDFDAAFESLRGYRHFHSFTCKGVLRRLQARRRESLKYFDEALARVPAALDSDLARARHFFLLANRFEVALLEEAWTGTRAAVARTDRELEALCADRAHTADTRVMLEKELAFCDLLRGQPAEALRKFEALIDAHRIDAHRDVPEYCVAIYTFAAAAAHEEGHYRKARKYYENAELSLAFCGDRLVFARHLSVVLPLCRHWGWRGEAARWVETIRALDCPERTREYLFKQARMMERSCRAGRVALV